MRTPEPTVAIGLAAVAVTAAGVGIGVGQLELAGHSHPDIWSSPWIVGAIFIAGVGLLGAVIVLAAGFLGQHGDGPDLNAPTPVSKVLAVEDKSMVGDGQNGAGSSPCVSTPVTEVLAVEGISIVHDDQPQREESSVIPSRRKWARLLIFLSVVLGVAITDTAAYWYPIFILFPALASPFALIALVAVTFLTLVAAATLGVAIARRGRDSTTHASVGVAIAAIAWLAPGMVMFLAELQGDEQFGFSARGALPEVIFLAAIYLTSGVYIALEVRHLFYSDDRKERTEWSPLLLRRAYLGGFALLIVVAAAILIIGLQAILELLLPNYTESLALLLAVGATLLALASAFRLGVTIASRGHRDMNYRSFDVAGPAAIWLVFGIAIFLSQWLDVAGYSNAVFLSNPSLGQQILGPLAFFAIYLVSGVCVIFHAGHFSESGHPAPRVQLKPGQCQDGRLNHDPGLLIQEPGEESASSSRGTTPSATAEVGGEPTVSPEH